jgi:hypothetical protein
MKKSLVSIYETVFGKYITMIRDEEKSGKYLTVLRAGLIFSQQKGAEQILARCMDRSNLHPHFCCSSVLAGVAHNFGSFYNICSVYCKFS